MASLCLIARLRIRRHATVRALKSDRTTLPPDSDFHRSSGRPAAEGVQLSVLPVRIADLGRAERCGQTLYNADSTRGATTSTGPGCCTLDSTALCSHQGGQRTGLEDLGRISMACIAGFQRQHHVQRKHQVLVRLHRRLSEYD